MGPISIPSIKSFSVTLWFRQMLWSSRPNGIGIGWMGQHAIHQKRPHISAKTPKVKELRGEGENVSVADFATVEGWCERGGEEVWGLVGGRRQAEKQVACGLWGAHPRCHQHSNWYWIIFRPNSYKIKPETKKRELSLDQAITLCARCGQLGVVKLLLGKGEFVDAKDEEGETPLHKAARQALDWKVFVPFKTFSPFRFGQHKVIKELLGAGADLGIPNNSGETAMSLMGNVPPDIVEEILYSCVVGEGKGSE